jgi:hypothetical protein
LNVAAAVLSCLFQAFPDSAKQLKEDRGLFHGPRPGVFDKVSRSRLRELVLNRNGIVVLTHDAGVAALRRALMNIFWSTESEKQRASSSKRLCWSTFLLVYPCRCKSCGATCGLVEIPLM